MHAAQHHLTHAPTSEDQAIARLIGALRRRSPGMRQRGREAPRTTTRAIRSAGAVAEWHAMGRTF